jgi:nitrogen regulatory protein P-II 2
MSSTAVDAVSVAVFGRSLLLSRSTQFMKLIIAIIQPHHLESVKTALSRVEVFRLTIMDCQGFGRQHGKTPPYGSDEFAGNLRRKIQLQIAVNEAFVEPTIEAIVEGGRSGDSGEVGDGKVFVLPMDDCVRIRTGERGPDAI